VERLIAKIKLVLCARLRSWFLGNRRTRCKVLPRTLLCIAKAIGTNKLLGRDIERAGVYGDTGLHDFFSLWIKCERCARLAVNDDLDTIGVVLVWLDALCRGRDAFHTGSITK